MEAGEQAVRPTYCIDTSSFIELQRRYGGDPFFDPFWALLARLAVDGRLVAPYEVNKEIHDGGRPDERLVAWADAHHEIFRPKGEQWESARRIVRAHPALVGHNEPTEKADPFVLALAVDLQGQSGLLYSHRCVVVAEETRVGGIRDAAAALDLRVLSLVELMREEGLAITSPS